MATWTRLEPEARRSEILAIARSGFARNDYASVSMADIAREAGVTPGLVNHYVGTKQELYLAVIDESAERLSQVVRTDLRDLPLEERIDRNTDEFLDSIERDRSDWALLFGAQGRSDPRVAERIAAVRAETIERMARNQTGGAEPSEELRLALRAFLGAAEAAAVELLTGRATREQVHGLLTGILRALVEQTPLTA